MKLTLNQFSYHLPGNHIAHSQAKPRDTAKLMLINRSTNNISHHQVLDLPTLLSPNTVVVFNNTKVIPARLHGHKQTGGKIELLLLRQVSPDTWTAITKPGLKPDQHLNFPHQLKAQVTNKNLSGTVALKFNQSGPKLLTTIYTIGHTPIPPYIHPKSSESKLRHQYQTIYAKQDGSAAAPTAGLHFTQELLQKLDNQNTQTEYLTLHVGLGTFQPLKYGQIETGKLHTEHFELSTEVASRLNQAKQEGKAILAVGTTTTRVLETCSNQNGQLTPQTGETDIFIKPPYRFKFVNTLMTNFHLPETSLLMLVSALVSAPNTQHQFADFKSSILGKAYQQAVKNNYRFYSFGDATLIL